MSQRHPKQNRNYFNDPKKAIKLQNLIAKRKPSGLQHMMQSSEQQTFRQTHRQIQFWWWHLIEFCLSFVGLFNLAGTASRPQTFEFKACVEFNYEAFSSIFRHKTEQNLFSSDSDTKQGIQRCLSWVYYWENEKLSSNFIWLESQTNAYTSHLSMPMRQAVEWTQNIILRLCEWIKLRNFNNFMRKSSAWNYNPTSSDSTLFILLQLLVQSDY